MTAQELQRTSIEQSSQSSGDVAVLKKSLTTDSKQPTSHVVESGFVSSDEADAQALAALGIEQQFLRDLGGLEIFSIGFSIFAVVPGLAVVFAYSLEGGPVAMVWGWLVASIFIVTIGLMMGELASAMPSAAGIYLWSYKLSPPWCRRQISWTVGYLSTVTSTTALASVNWATAQIILTTATIKTEGSFTYSNGAVFGVCTAVTLLETMICCLSTKAVGRAELLFLALNIGLILAVVIAVPIATPGEYRNSASFALGDFETGLGWNGGFAFVYGLLGASWTIANFDSLTRLSEECSNAQVAVPRALYQSISIAGVFGTICLGAITFSMGTDLEAISDTDLGNPLAQVFYNSLGKGGAIAMWIFIILAQIALGTSLLLASARQVFSFSRDDALPFSGWCKTVRANIPINATMYTAFVTTLFTAISASSDYSSSAIFSVSIVSMYLGYSVPPICRYGFYDYNKDFRKGPWHLGRFSFVIYLISVVWMVFMTVIAMFPASSITSFSEANYAVLVIAFCLFVTALYWVFPFGIGARHWFVGPPVEQDPSLRDQIEPKPMTETS
ncbi:uncharacterized protein L969DRAFT_91470 [Mixia osmundae IAM 14324]|uniref:Amino acid permease/ SLC12A domain-containing protein n=1 Tax=Mixia osmundae (strain CBS 9802 / IAM 14324 / JCM 22182 / KY 12970) TaxID=764103 RepID=G7E3Z5_MIXOS|nr:uncharacterized protein L969DRAFT_91470 [Mixia osmundae IAM 14324]KEI42002.1 hypothetical protein L969DRAFT_91470 [Mixia osmundae IAM 14324]GAA97555.1 hypothetical protein E5Q_04233 [Mixia osmundae IAM 14324]